MNDKGVTLVELLVVTVIGGMILIAASTVTNIGKESHRTLEYQSRIYNDISSGFKLLQNRVHENVSAVLATDSPGTPWIGQRLIVGDEAFGIYDHSDGGREFAYAADKNDLNTLQTILLVEDTDSISGSYVITGNQVVVTVTGAVQATSSVVGKDEIVSFSMTTTVEKRS